jgi:hypothetical protein
MQAALAFGTRDKLWLSVWRSDNDEGALVRGEWEIYGQLITGSLADFFIAEEESLP